MPDGFIVKALIRTNLLNKMDEIDYSVETEEEFYEDFSGRNLSYKELNNVLMTARKNSDEELRIIVKELQYTRFLLTNIIEFIDDSDESDLLTIQKLVKSYVEATIKTNKIK